MLERQDIEESKKRPQSEVLMSTVKKDDVLKQLFGDVGDLIDGKTYDV
jgi:hypothetical protein